MKYRYLPANRVFAQINAITSEKNVLSYCRNSLLKPSLGVAFNCLIAVLSALPSAATSPPVITPGSGVYVTTQTTATISGDAGANFYYTTDGSTPTISSTPYTSGISLGGVNTIKAIASLGGVQSTVTSVYIQSDSSTQPVPRNGLAMWLKPEFITSSSGKITQWTDLSGSSTVANATQTVAANQPSLLTSSLYGFNAVSFNGTNSFLNLPSYLTNLNNGYSVVAVLVPASSSTAKTLITSSSTGTQDMVSTQSNGTTVTSNVYNGATSGTLTTASGAISTSNYQILSIVDSAAGAASINVNSVSQATGAVQTPTNVTRSVNFIGTDNAKTSTSYWGGKIAEMLVYSRALSVTERANVEAYLSSRYQIANSTTTATPIMSLATSTLTAPTELAIAAGTPTAILKLTLDGTTPTSASNSYSGPLWIYKTTTVKAIAIDNGISSSVATVVLTLNSTQWPAPSATDTTPLQLNLQLPTSSIPQ